MRARCVDISDQVVEEGRMGGSFSRHFFAHSAESVSTLRTDADVKAFTLILTARCPCMTDQSALEQIFQIELGEDDE